MDKSQQLLDIYRKNPCRTLPNAYWKSAADLEDAELLLNKDQDGELLAFGLWKESGLIAYWCASTGNNLLEQDQINHVPFALVHEQCLPLFDVRDFSLRQAYFRLKHSGKAQLVDCPEGFVFKTVAPQVDLSAVVSLIRSCYRNINVDQEIVTQWLRHLVYDPELWVWIYDQAQNKPVGLGIAELDQQVPEASLEWVQVLPSYHKRGLGTAIVRELLARVDGKAAFTTVSGEVNNRSKPELLYRKCGFTGDDVWWLLRS